MILTKAPWIFDPNGDKDREDITFSYKAPEGIIFKNFFLIHFLDCIEFFFITHQIFVILGTEAERLTLYRAVRSTELAKRFYSMPSPGKEDVEFNLVDLERVSIGDPFTVTVNIVNKSTQSRSIQAILSAGSVYYTGVKANLVKKASGEFVVQPNASEFSFTESTIFSSIHSFMMTLMNYVIRDH